MDICFGRWDTKDHPIKDFGDENGYYHFPGKDYGNSYVKGFTKVREYKIDDIDRNSQPRMPWHDVHLMVQGDSAVDLSRHFIEYWNHAKFDKVGKKDDQKLFLRPTKTAKPLEFQRKGAYEIDESFEDFFEEAEEEKNSPVKLRKDSEELYNEM